MRDRPIGFGEALIGVGLQLLLILAIVRADHKTVQPAPIHAPAAPAAPATTQEPCEPLENDSRPATLRFT